MAGQRYPIPGMGRSRTSYLGRARVRTSSLAAVLFLSNTSMVARRTSSSTAATLCTRVVSQARRSFQQLGTASPRTLSRGRVKVQTASRQVAVLTSSAMPRSWFTVTCPFMKIVLMAGRSSLTHTMEKARWLAGGARMRMLSVTRRLHHHSTLRRMTNTWLASAGRSATRAML